MSGTNVTVEDDVVEDAPPAFTQANYRVDLVENEDGSNIPISLVTASATDPDAGDRVTYAISSTVAATEITKGDAAARASADLKALFMIESDSGVISYIGRGEDFATTNIIGLPITATSKGQSDTATVIIIIANIEPSTLLLAIIRRFGLLGRGKQCRWRGSDGGPTGGGFRPCQYLY